MTMFSLRLSSAFYVTVTAWGSRVVAAFAQLVSIPLLLQYLGPDQYAWLAVAISLQGWWLLADFGMGLSLQNSISERRVLQQEDSDLIISTAVVVLPVLFALLITLVLFSDSLALILLPAATIQSGAGGPLLIVTGVLSLPLVAGNVGYRILYARHQGYWVNIVPAVGSILSLGGLLILRERTVNNPLLWAAVAWLGPTSLLASGTFMLLLQRSMRDQRAHFRRSMCWKLLKRGSQFGLFSLFAAFTLQIDYVLIGKLLSAKDILLYSIVTKIMAFITFFYTAVVQAVWPLCSEAASLKKWGKVDILLNRLLGIGFGIVLAGAVAVWVLKAPVLKYLVPNQNLSIPPILWCLLTVYALVRVWSDAYAMLLQSMSHIKLFLAYIPVQATIAVVCQILLTREYGLHGLVSASILSFVLTSAFILPRAYYKLKIKNANSNE